MAKNEVDIFIKEATSNSKALISSNIQGGLKVSISNYRGFVYAHNNDMDPKIAYATFEISTKCNLESYMSEAYVKKVPDNYPQRAKLSYEYMKSGDDKQGWYLCAKRYLRNLLRKGFFNNVNKIRLEGTDFSASLVGIIDTVDVNLGFLTLTVNTDKLTYTKSLQIDIKDGKVTNLRYPQAPVYVLKGKCSDKYLTDAALEHYTISSVLHDVKYSGIVILCDMFEFVSKNFDDVGCIQRPTYPDSELRFLEKIRSTIDQSNVIIIQNESVWNEELMETTKFWDEWNGNDFKKIITDAIGNEEVPVVSLNLKEWKFIDKYCEKNDLTNFQSVVNLVDYLKEPRYGSAMRFDKRYTLDGIKYDTGVYFAYELDSEHGLMQMNLFEEVHESIVYIVSVSFENCYEFNLYNNIVTYESYFFVNDTAKLQPSYDELRGNSKLFDMDLQHLLSFIKEILSLLYTIQDRPRRTVVIQEERERKTHHDKKKSKTPNVAVRRILKTVYEARALLKGNDGDEDVDGNTEKKKRSEPVYTMPSWPVVGYWKHMTKSGKDVYVSPSEKHRRKPLGGNKEIIIKL